jgi:hypothetical protein
MKPVPEGARSTTTGDSEMKIDLVRLWASPSTLHLRVIYGPDSGAWVKSQELHIPWDTLPNSTREVLRFALDEERDEDRQDPLF